MNDNPCTSFSRIRDGLNVRIDKQRLGTRRTAQYVQELVICRYQYTNTPQRVDYSV